MSTGDYVLICLVSVVFVLALAYIYRNKKKGKCIGCSGDCSRCHKL